MIAQNSTGSMGKFDKKSHKMEVQKKVKKKIAKNVAFKNTGEEMSRNMDIFNTVTKNMK